MAEIDTELNSLEGIWPLQAELNRKVGIDTAAMGDLLRSKEAKGQLDQGSDVLLKIGRALKNYIDAMQAECHELQECLSWKHWYAEAREGRQYELQDLQNARVEATDMLFFWISICQLLGLRPQDIYRLYAQKLGINHKRRDENRSQAAHGDYESENRDVR
ncbi:MAG: hypothetical protein ACLFUJ_04515 [Phycisphaerae bacterium]